MGRLLPFPHARRLPPQGFCRPRSLRVLTRIYGVIAPLLSVGGHPGRGRFRPRSVFICVAAARRGLSKVSAESAGRNALQL